MLKHVGPYRSTSSLARASTNSLIRGLEDSSSRSSSFSRCPAVNSAPLEPTTSNSAISIQSKNSPLSATVATILSSNASKLFDPEETDAESETTQEEGYCGSSPECLRRSLSSPESCSSDYGSPEICKKHIRSSSLDKNDTGFRESCREEDLGSPESYKKSLLSSECVSDDSSSPELTKRREVSRPSTLPRRGAHKSMDGLATLKGGHQVLRKSFRSADSCSLHSTHSFSSLANGKLCSRSSSTSSLTDQAMTPVKVYLRFMRPDIEYKTLSLSSATTCRQLIVMLLAKFRLRHRDPNLFFVTMEVLVRGPGGAAPARQLLVLDDHARPAELQQCRPRGDARFSVGVRRGGLLRVHDSILMPGSQYKSLLVSYRTSSEELVQLLLNCYNNKENPNHYAIHEVVKNPYSDRPLSPDEFPLSIQNEWPRPTRHNYSFVLRRNLSYAFSLKSRLSWRRSLDQSSTDTESEHEEHNTTIGSLLSTSSVSSALSISSRSSLSSTTSESSDTSSSSGVSSASSLMTSPVSSPVKSPLFPGVPTSSSESNTSLKSGTGGGGTFLASKPPSSATAFMKTTSSSSVSAPTTTTTTSTPITAPTPVPRTILNTNSTGNSKTLPLPPRTRSYTNSYCSCCPTKTTLSSTSSSSLKLHPSSLTSTTLSALSTSLSSLLSRSVSIPSVDTGTSTPSSVPSPTSPPSSSILSSKPPINSTSNTLTTTASKAVTTTTIASSSKPTINPTSNTITTTASKAVTTTTTASSSSNTTSTKQQEHQRSEFRGPPQPLRRSSCCRNLENCFYI